MNKKLIEINNIKKYFPIKGGIFFKEIGKIYAVNGVSFHINEGETLGLVGESGCGKSTLGRTILNLYKPTAGEILFNNINILKANKKELVEIKKNMQIIFQDPFESLNSRFTIYNILEEPLIIHKIKDHNARKKIILNLIDKVGLPINALDRFPHEFSGGQRQRIGIARAIALNPKFIVCDEPVSALDVSIQSQILNLLLDLQKELKLTLLFIAHDLSVVRHISDRIAVMYLGKIVELTDSDTIYSNPIHPYTKALISSIPIPDPKRKNEKRIILQGDVPSPSNPPKGCSFHTRCPFAIDICKNTTPILENLNKNDHQVSCHRKNEKLW